MKAIKRQCTWLKISSVSFHKQAKEYLKQSIAEPGEKSCYGKPHCADLLLYAARLSLSRLSSLRCSAQPQPSFLKKMLADSEVILEDTKVELEADEECFMATKSACREKVADWSEYSRLRAKELQRMVEALLIVSSPEAPQIFENARLRVAYYNKKFKF